MTLRLAPEARDFLRSAAPQPRKALRLAVRQIATDPRHPDLDVKLLEKQGPHRFWRARVLDRYRIIYSRVAGHTYVWRIIHRSEGYGWLDRLDPDG